MMVIRVFLNAQKFKGRAHNEIYVVSTCEGPPPPKKQGQKLVLSDALAVQSQGLLDLKGYQGRKVSSLKVITR